VKTAQQYIDSLRQRKIKVYLKGQLLDPQTLVDHPFIRGHVASAALTFELAHEPESEELMTRIMRFPALCLSMHRGCFTFLVARPMTTGKWKVRSIRGMRSMELSAASA